MRKLLFTLLIVTIAVTMVYSTAFAGAFRIPEAGTPAMGQANAFVGQADDPSAVHHNSAGITQLEGTQFMSGMNIIKPTAEANITITSSTAKAKEETFYTPYFFYTNNLGESDWWFGFGLNAPFGLGTEWDVGDFLFPVTKTSIEIVKVAPVVAYRVNENFSVGFGPEYYKVLDIIYNGGPGDAIQINGDGSSFGFGLSALYQVDKLKIGFGYHGNTTPTIDASAENFPIAGGPRDGEVDIKLPATMVIGLNYQASDKVSLNLDVDQTKWSSYDELVFKVSPFPNVTFTKKYEDVTAIRVGGSYKVDDKWTLRAGYLTEPSPVPDQYFDPRLPDADATAIFLGGGYDAGQWSVNAAYMALTKDDRDVDSGEPTSAITGGSAIDGLAYDGEYKATVDILSVDLTYRF